MWLNERNAVALDESWREPTNLQAKVLKHQSFESEILANRYRVDAATKVECVCVCVFGCRLVQSGICSVCMQREPAVIYNEQSVVCRVTNIKT